MAVGGGDEMGFYPLSLRRDTMLTDMNTRWGSKKNPGRWNVQGVYSQDLLRS